MTEAPTQGQGQDAPEAQGTQGTEVPEGYVPQAQVSKIAAREKGEGKQAAINDLLQQTGAESIDDVLAAYTEYQGIQEAVTTEADRANQRAEKLEKRATQAEERYTNTLREYALRDSLRDAGINPERLKGAMRLADLSALEVDGEGNVQNVEAVVEAVQTEAPEWFGEQARPRVNAPQTTGTGVQRPTGDPNQDMGRGFLGWLTEPIPDNGGGFP
jgi:hypothetical protein